MHDKSDGLQLKRMQNSRHVWHRHNDTKRWLAQVRNRHPHSAVVRKCHPPGLAARRGSRDKLHALQLESAAGSSWRRPAAGSSRR